MRTYACRCTAALAQQGRSRGQDRQMRATQNRPARFETLDNPRG